MIKWLKSLFKDTYPPKSTNNLLEKYEKDRLKDAQMLQDIEDGRMERKADSAGYDLFRQWFDYNLKRNPMFGIDGTSDEAIVIIDPAIMGCIILEHYPAKSKHNSESLRKIAFEAYQKYKQEFLNNPY